MRVACPHARWRLRRAARRTAHSSGCCLRRGRARSSAEPQSMSDTGPGLRGCTTYQQRAAVAAAGTRVRTAARRVARRSPLLLTSLSHHSVCGRTIINGSLKKIGNRSVRDSSCWNLEGRQPWTRQGLASSPPAEGAGAQTVSQATGQHTCSGILRGGAAGWATAGTLAGGGWAAGRAARTRHLLSRTRYAAGSATRGKDRAGSATRGKDRGKDRGKAPALPRALPRLPGPCHGPCLATGLASAWG